jgi:hypothetical protein
MNHLSQEELVVAYYGESDTPAAAHVASCDECRSELDRIRAVLDRVTPADVPDPGDDYERVVWDRLQWRLEHERRSERRTSWTAWAGIAAAVTVAFFLGLFWKRSNEAHDVRQVAQTRPSTSAQPVSTGAPMAQQRDRILLVVVADHFDASERVLVELSNLKASNGSVDISSEQRRAENLLASNRLYRTTASEHGEESVATLLDELEPVLMQIAHTPGEVSSDELQTIQKRLEAKGLVFKLRVARAGARSSARPNVHQPSV